MPAGRPPKYKNAEELEESIKGYFDSLKKDDKYIEYPSITKLAFYLGFCSRQSMYDYKKNEKFSYTIKRAVLQIEIFYESLLLNANVTGPIFALKNLGWKDKVEQHNTGGLSIEWNETKTYDSDEKADNGS